MNTFSLPPNSRLQLIAILGESEQTDQFIAQSENSVQSARLRLCLEHPTFTNQLSKLEKIRKHASKLADALEFLTIEPGQKNPTPQTDYDTLHELASAAGESIALRGSQLWETRNSLLSLIHESEVSARFTEEERRVLGPRKLTFEIKLFVGQLITNYCFAYGWVPAISKDPESAFCRAVELLADLAGFEAFTRDEHCRDELRRLSSNNFRDSRFTTDAPKGFHPNA